MLLKFPNVILEDGLYVEKKLWKSYQKSGVLLQGKRKTTSSCPANVSVFLRVKSGSQSSQEFLKNKATSSAGAARGYYVMQCIVISELVMTVDEKSFGGNLFFIESPKKPPKYIELGMESPKVVEWSVEA